MTTTNPETASKRSCKAARAAKANLNCKAARAADAPPPATTAPKQPTKASIVEALLTRATGASLEDMCAATAWLPHTCRAFLTGLRKKGRTLERSKREDSTTIYRLGSVASVGAGEGREAAEATS